MGEDVLFNYAVVGVLKSTGDMMLSGMMRWGELYDTVQKFLPNDDIEYFLVWGQTELGKGKVSRVLDEIGELIENVTIDGKTIPLERWGLRVDVVKNKLVFSGAAL